ncbi:hypothetical protein L2E82_20875 [Cichorium intybus]|uniref:Uncharacterized protein n=1 Tax=Cichorium intybus TaxID=13427 RepID=A0ACB9DUM6_CICIN|nr:hypothetical protein L2E82_20875 [Cichorium intybus]
MKFASNSSSSLLIEFPLPACPHDPNAKSNTHRKSNRREADFGMARHMSAGRTGYVPPEYYQSFKCSTKGDVYSYGVVLLELLSGKQPTDSPDFGDNNLVGWVKQHRKTKISDVFYWELLREDPGLEIELLQHLRVAVACLDDRAWNQPTMIQVMAMFKEIQAGAGIDSGSTIAGGEAHFSTVQEVLKGESFKSEGLPTEVSLVVLSMCTVRFPVATLNSRSSFLHYQKA